MFTISLAISFILIFTSTILLLRQIVFFNERKAENEQNHIRALELKLLEIKRVRYDLMRIIAEKQDKLSIANKAFDDKQAKYEKELKEFQLKLTSASEELLKEKINKAQMHLLTVFSSENLKKLSIDVMVNYD
jgi:hypothetical protein